ncbi:MAG: hypothetical protein LBD96_01290, partial [Treponema sp.]|nr:hypothetical protein [Treponema sp.]
SHSQNSVSFGNGFGKSGQKSAFSSKSKVAFPKTEVLGKPPIQKKCKYAVPAGEFSKLATPGIGFRGAIIV